MALLNRVGFSPLPWWLNPRRDIDEGAREPLDVILSCIAANGFDGVPAEIPDDSSPDAYRRLLAEHSLSPAPGYFSAPFADADALPATLEAARQVAKAHRQLGLTEIFLADDFASNTIRHLSPAQGAGFDQERLSTIAGAVARTAEVFVAFGIYPCLHPHVGTWIETGHEAAFVLESVDKEVLGFGPDTGHLTWAGADILELVEQFGDRVRAIHLKDVHADVVDRAREESLSYFAATAEHLWTEPAQGDVALDAFLSALPRTFEGWAVIEVDIADQATPMASAEVSAAWMTQRIHT